MMNEGIVKINSKMLDSADLKRLDKQEKENISWTGAVVKGRNIYIVFKYIEEMYQNIETLIDMFILFFIQMCKIRNAQRTKMGQ